MQKDNLALSISELTAAIQLQLIKSRYSPTTLCIYDCIWRDLLQYCDKNKIVLFDLNVGNAFSRDCYNHTIGDACSKNDDFRKKTVGRAMQYLLDFQSYGVIFETTGRGGYNWHPRFKPVFEAYIAEMLNLGYAKSTMFTIKSCVKCFEMFLLQKDIAVFSDINREDVEIFILTFSKYSKSTLPNRIYYLARLLTFAYEKGFTKIDLTAVCPKVSYTNSRNAIPSTFTADEVKSLMAAVDRANPCGKRDYAFLLLVARLGLRSVDARNLQFEDIDWHQKTIRIFQSKTKETVTLPLLDEIGWAIIDYLKNGRPQTKCSYIFVKHNGDFTEFQSNPYPILQKYLARAGIASEYERRHGLHALRHSLASRLLEKETPLPVISGILGHANSNTTAVYLKIDIAQLRMCALEVPT